MASQSSDGSLLIPGARVRLEGLQSMDKQALNGSEGNVESWDAERSRYIVVFNNGSRLALNERNLKVRPPPPPASEGATCVVCLENGSAHFAAVPCGHQCLCKGCVDKLKQQGALLRCPTCRVPVSSFIQIFIPEPAVDEHGETALEFLDKVKASYQAAESARSQAEAKLSQAEEDLEVAEAKRVEAEQVLTEAESFRCSSAERLAEAEAEVASVKAERVAVQTERAALEARLVEFNLHVQRKQGISMCGNPQMGDDCQVASGSGLGEVELPSGSVTAAGHTSACSSMQAVPADGRPHQAQACDVDQDEVHAVGESGGDETTGRKRPRDEVVGPEDFEPGPNLISQATQEPSFVAHASLEPWEKCQRAWEEQLSLVISLED